jgi:hypothetical protein
MGDKRHREGRAVINIVIQGYGSPAGSSSVRFSG